MAEVNETVSLGDTVISLHTLQLQVFLGAGVFLGSQNSKCQVLDNFSFSAGGGGRRGGGVFLGSQNSKCQVLDNFSFGWVVFTELHRALLITILKDLKAMYLKLKVFHIFLLQRSYKDQIDSDK